MPRVIHFEFHADEPERAAKFYGSVFGWKIEKWDGMDYWMVTTGPDNEPGINGGIVKRMNQGTTYNVVGVPSVDEFAKKIENAGGIAIMAKKAIPGIGWYAYYRDTEGNVFGIMESDPSAK